MADRLLEFCKDLKISKKICNKAIRENDLEMFRLFYNDCCNIDLIITCTNVDIIKCVIKNIGRDKANILFAKAITFENITLLRELYYAYGLSVTSSNSLHNAVCLCNVKIVNFLICDVGLQFISTIDYYEKMYYWGKSYDNNRKYMFHLLMMHGAVIYNIPKLIDSLVYIKYFEMTNLFIDDVPHNILKEILQKTYISLGHESVVYLAERGLRFRLDEISKYYEYVRYNSKIYYALTDEQREVTIKIRPDYVFDATWPKKKTWTGRPMTSYYDISFITTVV